MTAYVSQVGTVCMTNPKNPQQHAAIVTKVNDDGTVNCTAFNPAGHPVPHKSVSLDTSNAKFFVSSEESQAIAEKAKLEAEKAVPAATETTPTHAVENATEGS